MTDAVRDEFYGHGGPGRIIGELPRPEGIPSIAAVDRESLNWIKRLGAELDRRSVDYVKADAYYRGEHGPRFIKTRFRELFARLFEHYRENFCAVVVDSIDERLDVDGFRFPAAAGTDPAATDPAAWQIWQDNGLDARSQLAHTEALIKGLCYVLVSPFDRERVGGRSPLITVEDPCQVIVATSPSGSERIVGMKRWQDDIAGIWFATLYFPDRIEKWQATQRRWANQHASGVTGEQRWERRVVDGEVWPLDNPLEVVPIVPLVNRPRLGRQAGMFSAIEGRSDIADVMPIQDAINEIALDGLVAVDKAAFPQKWASGVEIPIDPDTKKPMTPWKPDIEALFATPVVDAKFGSFDAADLAQYSGQITAKLLSISAITQLPMRVFVQQTGQPSSGEALDASEVMLNKKAERKHRYLGEGWEEVVRLAFLQLGDTARATDTACEAVWKPATSEPSAAKVDAVTKEIASAHVPLDVAWERLGYSATQRALFPEMLKRQARWLAPLIAAIEPVVPDKTPPIDASAGATPAATPEAGGAPE
jgi:hypothetical protein